MLTFNLTDSVSLPDSTKEPHLQCSVLPAKKFHLMKNPPQNLNLKWIAVLKEMLRMEKLCAAIGFTKEMIESLLTKKEAIRCNGRIYSEEHRRKFDIRNDIFKVEKNPTDDSKLVLTINRQPIGEWFKEQFGKLGYGFRKTPDEPKKGSGFKL